jgi:hypothetical protein
MARIYHSVLVCQPICLFLIDLFPACCPMIDTPGIRNPLLPAFFRPLGKDCLDFRDLAKIHQSREYFLSVAEAGILVGPMLEQGFDVTMGSHETVGPKRNATFMEAACHLFRRRLENAGSGNDHLKLSVHSAESGQHSFPHFADQLYGQATRFALRRDTVFGKTSRTQFAG